MCILPLNLTKCSMIQTMDNIHSVNTSESIYENVQLIKKYGVLFAIRAY